MKILIQQKPNKQITPRLIHGYSVINVNPSDFNQIPINGDIRLPNGLVFYDNDDKHLIMEYNFDVSEPLHVAEKLGKDLIPQICLKIDNLDATQIDRTVEYSNDYNSKYYKPNYIKLTGVFQRFYIDKNNPNHRLVTELINYKCFMSLDLDDKTLKVDIVIDLSKTGGIKATNFDSIGGIGDNMKMFILLSYIKYQKQKTTILTGEFDFENTDFYKEAKIGRMVTSSVSRNQYLDFINCLNCDYSKKYINNHKFFELNKKFLDEHFRKELICAVISSAYACKFHIDFDVDCIYGDCDENYRWKGKKHRTKLSIDKSTVTIDPVTNKFTFSGLLYDKNKKLKDNETFANKVICMYQVVYNIATGQFTMDFINLHCGRMIVNKPVKVKISYQHDLIKNGTVDNKTYMKLLQK